MREMKDSGAMWIGMVPKDWKVDKLRYHLRRTEPKNPGETIVLSLYRELGIVPKDSRDDNHNVTSEDTSKYKYVHKGDFVINKMKAWQGSVAVSDYDGIVSPAYYVYHFTDDLYDKRYFHYLLRGCYKDEFMRLSAGIRIGQWDLPSDALDNTLVLIPKKEEQERIANYLDRRCAEIDALSTEIQKQIDTLEQYKKSVITEAVTKGLNPNVEMKDSGVEWIGEIPMDWSTPAIKHVTKKVVCGIAATPEYVDENEGILFLSAQNIQNDKIDLSIKKYIPIELHKKITKNVKPEKGDILQVRVGASIGKAAIVDIDDEFSVYVSLSLIKVNEKIINRYLMYYLSTNSFRRNAELFIDFAGTQGNLNVADLKDMRLPLPPLKRQKEIADYLDEKCSEIDSIIAEKKKQLEVVADYKKSLIYEYVTGKKEVR